MKIQFARDEHGNIKKKQPCQTPGCNWPNWHVCLVGKPDTFPQLLNEEEKDKRERRLPGPRTEAHREAIAEAQRERWARIRATYRVRDELMIQRYSEGAVSVAMLEKEFDIGKRVVLRVLKEAEEAGKITRRPPGLTLANGAR